jgi:hypothetical protein
MGNYKLHLKMPGLSQSLAVLMAIVLCLAPVGSTAAAQSGGTVESGATIAVRTNDEINVTRSDGRVFSGSVAEDVRDTEGRVALPRGTYVEMIVRQVGDREYALDLESVSINGQRLGVEADTNAVTAERKEGLGANSRTGKYVGGGAVVGAIIGAITGGGKGAAIGAGVGAAGGAGAQVLTRGSSVKVPSESLVTFRLQEALQTSPDRGFSRNGWHYHPGYGTEQGDSSAYQAGLTAGRADRSRGRTFNSRTTQWRGADLRDYEDGYERGFDESVVRNNPPGTANAEVRIGADHYIRWKGPEGSKVYVEEDDGARQLFASGTTGTQEAPWIRSGHKFTFILVDPNGREIARDVNDLRQRRSYNYR